MSARLINLERIDGLEEQTTHETDSEMPNGPMVAHSDFAMLPPDDFDGPEFTVMWEVSHEVSIFAGPPAFLRAVAPHGFAEVLEEFDRDMADARALRRRVNADETGLADLGWYEQLNMWARSDGSR